MKTKFKEIIYSQLKEAQEKYGGYTGKDITTISRKINRQPKTVKRQIEKLREEDASFSNFTYIGKRYIDLTFDEISFLQYKLQDNCLMLKSLLLEELNKRRIEEGKSQIPPSTFYKFLENLLNSMEIDKNDPYKWLKTKGITVTEKYSIENAKASIQTLFSFRDLKNKSVADLEVIYGRLKECERWLEENYTGIGNLISHYDRIKKRKHKLRSLLASIKSDKSIAIQIRLIFEIQVCFFVDLLDFLIEQLIVNKGRIYRLMSDKRAKVENRLREERLSAVEKDICDLYRGHIGKEKLFNRVTNQISIETLARVELLKSHKSVYSKLLNILRSLTANFSEDVIEIHHDTAKVIIESLPITEEEYTISYEMLNEMLENKLDITAEPYPGFNFASESEMEDSIKRVYFRHVLDKVIELVKENNPDWFDMHKEVFFEIFDSLFPAYSSKCKSSDSEAMHVIEILNHVNGFLNANIKVYVGDCHTTSKVAAAMSYLSYRVIAAGRTKIKPVELTKSMKEKIKANLELLNKVGKLSSMDGEYGKIIASKEHIYVNGTNIRALLDDSGSVILTKVIGENCEAF